MLCSTSSAEHSRFNHFALFGVFSFLLRCRFATTAQTTAAFAFVVATRNL